jgi:Na+/H+-dicarboxylate symporter
MTSMTEPAREPMPEIRVPALLTFLGLVGGIVFGLTLSNTPWQTQISAIAAPVGTLWLHALQMTIVPLITGLLFTGIVQTVAAAEGGQLARRAVLWIAMFLFWGALLTGLLLPLALGIWPIPPGAVAALSGGNPGAETQVPGLGAFLGALIPENVLDAAARSATLPLLVFVALFALGTTRLAPSQRDLLSRLFAALAGAMMVMIGWVLALAPIGVFALGFGVAANSGMSAVAALAHYIAMVAGMGALVLITSYAATIVFGHIRLGAFTRAVLPVQALAFSTQSSLACLPAMLVACRKLGLRESTAELVLPLAVALFRATGPAMNLAVAIYAAKLTGVTLTPGVIAAGLAVSLVTTLGAVSLPGTLTFISSCAPIALAMGVPIEPLGLLIAVEMLPDIMRTLGNATMDVALVAIVDRRRGG